MRVLAVGDSMYPTLRHGNKYTVDTHYEGIAEGDIVVFFIRGQVICHRVKRKIQTKNNRLFFETQGDNCKQPDPFVITDKMIIGKVVVPGSNTPRISDE